MRIAVEGCCHGELDRIYDTIAELERLNRFKVDLLIICGDFQAVRNVDDLQAMAVPPKYQKLNTFYKYYSGEKVAPVLTLFIGGNHEASNYLQELPYGGWVAPRIYYLGYAGIIQVGGLRIGGISGIYKGRDYNRGHFEHPPYSNDTIRSVYHVRNLEVFRLKQVTRPLDIFISHDWPKGIYHYGNTSSLVKYKPYFQKEIDSNELGSAPLSDLLGHLQPSYWFAAHLHVKFAAHVQHKAKSEGEPARSTKFLALDKCLPKKRYLQILDLVSEVKQEDIKIQLDPEWLTILQKTDHLFSLSAANQFIGRSEFQVTEAEIENTLKLFDRDLTLPENFQPTAAPLVTDPGQALHQRRQELTVMVNPQTTLLCSMLDLTDPNARLLGTTSQQLLDQADSSQKMEEDSGDDVEDDDDVPSSVDISSDASRQDGYLTANDSLGLLDLMSPGRTSTPAKDLTGLKQVPFSIPVGDQDEEFLSIISAQKSKRLESSAEPLPDCDSSSSPILSKDNIGCQVVSANGQSPSNVNADTAITSNSAPPRTIIDAPVVSSSVDNDRSTDAGVQSSPLQPKRTSFGLSGLCLDSSAGTTPEDASLARKREVSDSSLSQSTDLSVKKLKRRNISLYVEETS